MSTSKSRCATCFLGRKFLKELISWSPLLRKEQLVIIAVTMAHGQLMNRILLGKETSTLGDHLSNIYLINLW